MNRYTLERYQLIAAPLEEAFRFFEDPRNLAEITPAWLGFRIIDVGRLPLRAGSEIEYRIKWLGISRRWRTLIEAFDGPNRFVDVQVEGPYHRWRHEHLFEAQGERTLMRDRVEYQLPYGVAGRVVHWAVVSRQLQRIFDYRAARVHKIFREDRGRSLWRAPRRSATTPPTGSDLSLAVATRLGSPPESRFTANLESAIPVRELRFRWAEQ